MAETQRTLTALLLLLADNGTGDISPEDVRDIVETFRSDHAQLYVSTPAATTIGVAGTFVKGAGTTTLSSPPTPENFSMPADNKLLYNGPAKRTVKVVCNFSVTCASSSQVLAFRMAKNGTDLVDSEIEHKIGTGADRVAASVAALIEMVNTDYVELFLTNKTSTGAVTLEKMNMIVFGSAHDA